MRRIRFTDWLDEHTRAKSSSSVLSMRSLSATVVSGRAIPKKARLLRERGTLSI